MFLSLRRFPEQGAGNGMGEGAEGGQGEPWSSSASWGGRGGDALRIEPYVVKLIKDLGKHKSSVRWLLAQVHNFLAIAGGADSSCTAPVL